MAVKVQVIDFNQHGIHYVQDVLPMGYVVIDQNTPASCPWDYYGMTWQRERQRVLAAVKIECLPLETRKTILNPAGTGPRGAVRFGDNMMPHDYFIAVPQEQETAARAALAEHRKAVDEWLFNGGKMPDACRG